MRERGAESPSAGPLFSAAIHAVTWRREASMTPSKVQELGTVYSADCEADIHHKLYCVHAKLGY